MQRIDELYEIIHQEESSPRGMYPGIGGYRVKSIRSGPLVECEIYPVWYTAADRKKIRKHTGTRAAQQKLNEINSIKQLTRLINANFTERDIWLTLTYDDDHLPHDYETAVKDSGNYIRRLRRALASAGSEDQLKYIVVTEIRTADGEPVRAHHHIVCNFPDRDVAESLWRMGGRTQSRRLQPDNFEYSGLAGYLGKQSRSRDPSTRITRRWRVSRNLARPRITTADKKITRRRVSKLAAASEQERIDFFRKLYPNHRYLDCKIRYSDYVPGAYISVRLRR